MQKMGQEGQCTPLQGRCFTFTWVRLASPYLAQLWVANSHLLACRRKCASQAQPELEAERHEGTLFSDSGWCFFPLILAVLAFASSALLLWTLETPSDLPCSAGNLQYLICFIIFCHLASILLVLSEVQAVSPCAATAHSTRRSRPHVSSCVSKILLSLLFVFVNCNALHWLHGKFAA